MLRLVGLHRLGGHVTMECYRSRLRLRVRLTLAETAREQISDWRERA